jgi:hypothetical protein
MTAGSLRDWGKLKEKVKRRKEKVRVRNLFIGY